MPPFSLRLGPNSLPEPDAAVGLRPVRALLVGNYLVPTDLRIVAEVSDATLGMDLTTKANLYAAANVTELWVVDVTGRRLLVHTLPTADGYTQVIEFSEFDRFAPAGATADFVIAESLP